MPMYVDGGMENGVIRSADDSVMLCIFAEGMKMRSAGEIGTKIRKNRYNLPETEENPKPPGQMRQSYRARGADGKGRFV